MPSSDELFLSSFFYLLDYWFAISVKKIVNIWMFVDVLGCRCFFWTFFFVRARGMFRPCSTILDSIKIDLIEKCLHIQFYIWVTYGFKIYKIF